MSLKLSIYHQKTYKFINQMDKNKIHSNTHIIHIAHKRHRSTRSSFRLFGFLFCSRCLFCFCNLVNIDKSYMRKFIDRKKRIKELEHFRVKQSYRHTLTQTHTPINFILITIKRLAWRSFKIYCYYTFYPIVFPRSPTLEIDGIESIACSSLWPHSSDFKCK